MATNEFSKNDTILKIRNNPKKGYYVLLAQLQSAISSLVMVAFSLYTYTYHPITYILKEYQRGNLKNSPQRVILCKRCKKCLWPEDKR